MTNLTHGRLRALLHYDPETGEFTRRRAAGARAAGSVAGTRAVKNGGIAYWQIQVDGKLYLAHRLAWFYVTGEWPENLIDHKDRDGLNNRWGNLREATTSQNQQNNKCRSNNTTGLKGVGRCRGKWQARLFHNGRLIYLGTFNNPSSAHAAYVAASKAIFGEFARAA